MKKAARQIDEAFEEAARLSGSNLPPTDFYQKFLARALAGIDGHAGAVWLRTPQGFLQLQCQANLDKVGLDAHKGGRQTHNELLRVAFQGNQPMMLEPFGRVGTGEGQVAANLTEYVVILAPILIDDKQPVGLLEVWVEPAWDPRIHPTYRNYVIQMAGYASQYVRHSVARQSSNQEQVWTQLEAFSRQVHSSLNSGEVAFQVANEGRRLVGCDRISVGVRHGRRTTVESVSGADVVEKASKHVRRMRDLFDAVLNWGEKLVYKGEKDETLPPAVYEALDAYLAESTPKLLVLLPLKDEREKESHAKPRSALLMECFEPPEQVEPLIQRLDVVAGHAAPALYNAAEMKRIPLKLLWKPLAVVQGKVGGKARFYTFLGLAALIGLVAALCVVPYPLKLEAKGQLVPVERLQVFSKRDGRAEDFKVNHGDTVRPGMPLVTMFDPELQKEVQQKIDEIRNCQGLIRQLDAQIGEAANPNTPEILKKATDRDTEHTKLKALTHQLREMERIHNCVQGRPGYFQVLAPPFSAAVARTARPEWTVLNSDFREQMQYKTVKPSDPILRLGNKNGTWEVELKIPQKHIGQVLKAYADPSSDAYLDVDVLLTSVPTHVYKGRLYRRNIGGEAVPNRDDHNESEPVVYAYVRINEADFAPEDRIPQELLVTGVEVHTKVRCGDHAMGYSLFYGLWEFFYQHVVFFF